MLGRSAWVGLILLVLASPASLSSDVLLMYRPALGTSVPVPVGWQVGEYQRMAVTVLDPEGSHIEYLGTTETVIYPPVWVVHGPRITIEHLPDTVDVLVSRRCQPPAIVLPTVEGPTAIAGHPGSYRYLCAPRTRIGPEWTVLMPVSGHPGTWRFTYLGAPGIGAGSLSRAFGMVLANFSP
jgi:hypothetical protein